MQSIEALKLSLAERRTEIAGAVDAAVFEEQKKRMIEDVKGLEVLAYSQDLDFVGGIEAHRKILMEATSIEDLKVALIAKIKDLVSSEIQSLDNESVDDREKLVALKGLDLESINNQIRDLEALTIDSMADTAVKVDERTWVLIANGKTFLYETKAIGAGDNGSVHALVNTATGDAGVIKLQYGRMDVTAFEKTGRTFSDDNIENAEIVVANGQEYVISIDKDSGTYQVDILLADEDDSSKKFRGTNDPIFLKKINDKYYNFEFVSQTGSVVQKEHEKSANYKPNGRALGIERSEILSDNINREFLNHVIPVPERPTAGATAEEHEQYELKIIARQLLLDKNVDTAVFALVQDFIPGDSLDRLMDSKKQLLVQTKGTPEVKSVNALNFASLLINSMVSLQSKQNGGEYHPRDSKVQGVYHRDIRPGNVKLTPDGRIIFIDLGAAVEFEQDRVVVAKMGQTEGYTHPEITEAIDQNLGREVKFAYAERHEAYTMMRLVQDYLKAFVEQNPDTAQILNPIITKLDQDWQKLDSFDKIQTFMQEQNKQIRPAILRGPSTIKTKIIPKTQRPFFSNGKSKPISARMAALINKYEHGDGQLAESKDATIQTGVSVKELRKQYNNPKTKTVQPDVVTTNNSKPTNDRGIRGKNPSGYL